MSAELTDEGKYTDPVDYTTDSSVEGGWVKVVKTFTPQVTGTASAYIIGEGAEGIFYVDDIQLEKGEAPSNFNLLENGDLQSDDTSAFGWTLKEDVSFCNTVGVNATGQGNHSIKIEGDCQNKYAYAIQTVYINKLGQQSYVLSGWGKADAVVDNITLRSNPAYDHTKQFGLRATVYYRNDTDGEYTEYFYVPYNPDVSTWQYASLTITPEQTNKYVDHINISCVYECNANTAWFDNLSLVNATVQQLDYDNNGKPISSASTGLNGQSITYDDNGNVKTVTTPNPAGGTITQTYTYDSTFTHRLVSSTNGIVKQSMSHDSVGNVVATTLQSATNSSAKVITSSAVFTNGGNLQSSVTDSAGAVTSYAYEAAQNIAWGAPSKVTDAKGTETAYTFDNFGRYENITVDNGAGLKYIYSDGKLSQIQRKADGQTTLAYSFGYDEFGNTTQIQVGNKILAEYVYGAKNGMLLSQSYGNQDSVSFTYDNLGRAKTTTYSSGRVLSYIYTGDGQLYSVHDSATGYTYIYTYDPLGRLTASRVEDSSSQVLIRTKLWYNASNQITKQAWTIGDTTYEETYTYNTGDATLSAYHNPLGQTVSLSYDYLRRLSTVTAGNVYTQTYTYRDLDDSKTTTQVSGLSYSGLTDAHSFGYTYDALGNIATYTENGVTYTYSYDDLNQLVSQTGGGKTYAYTYDLGGNILTASDGTASHTYTYGDADWADLLTAYDGQSITYDASGNPLSYYNGSRYTFTWEEGRRLATSSGNGHNISYNYDSQGLRLSRTVDGTKTYSYVYIGDQLMEMTIDDNGTVRTLSFFYDNSSPYAVKVTSGGSSSTYYYVLNLQGDVTAIVNSAGKTVVEYTYDPWGKLLSIDGEYKNGLGIRNPLRYRGYVYDQESGLYYLQSRYYDPTTCRFINADEVLYYKNSLGNHLFAYCENSPVACIDPFGYGKIYVIYYEDDFEKQAKNSPGYDSDNEDVIFIGVSTAQEFVDAWNSMEGEIDDVYLYVHGGKGELYFYKEDLGFSGEISFNDLEDKTVDGMIFLLSCKGGKGKEGNNVAWMFAQKSSTSVRACTGGVSYTKFDGVYYPRKSFRDFGMVYTFYYGKRNAFTSEKVAKKRVELVSR